MTLPAPYQTVSFAPHPVRLRDIFFPDYQFKRGSTAKPPYRFPRMVLHSAKDVRENENILIAVVKISSEKGFRSPAATFKITAVAVFESDPNYSDPTKALKEFASSASAYTLMWPYIRAFVAESMDNMGLPEYHLPLVVAWQEVDDGSFAASARISK